MIERGNPILSNAINLRQSMVTGAGAGLVPCRFVEGIVSLIITVQAAKTKAQIVIGFAIVRIRVAPRQAFDGSPKVIFARAKFAAAQVRQPEGVVAPRVERIASQGF